MFVGLHWEGVDIDTSKSTALLVEVRISFLQQKASLSVSEGLTWSVFT